MQTVGEVLRAEREKRGMTVKDIEAATSIRALYISAIENNKFSIVPGEVYLKGFIRNYANYLGLNGQEMVEIYRKSQNPPAPVIVQVDQDLQQPTPSEQRKEARQSRVTSDPQARDSSSSGKWLAIALASVVIAGAGWWFAVVAGKPSAPAPQQPVKVAPSAPIQPLQPPVTPAVPQQQVPINTKPVALIVKFTEDCWVQVVADGKEIYEGILKSGESRKWEADQTIVVKFGNAGAVELIHNGRSVGKLGAPGDVIVRTFGQ